MELLLDPGERGALRGLRTEGPDVGAVHLPEGVTPLATEDTESTEQTPQEHAARLLARRRRLMGRMVRPAPAQSGTPPRGFTGPR